ncbi:hypothetical protein CVT24_012650 [Panaeolus cyanescens]|uniref:Uncharacterized protein n=1 Tax=Panaeolus cyanescens TaxID=181874 RepID=A0A409W2A5_9AGAR|nr:hypothetical protein CVT24_012650 [Panaeolus cyanescens]
MEEGWTRKNILEADLAQANTSQELELSSVLESQLQETTHVLDRFATQLAEFGSAPDGIPGLQGDLATYFTGKYGQKQQYIALLQAFEHGWTTRDQMHACLGWPQAREDPEWKAAVEDTLQQTINKLPVLAKELVDFGPPPDGVSGPQDDMNAYIETRPWLDPLTAASYFAGEMIMEVFPVKESAPDHLTAGSVPGGLAVTPRSKRSRFRRFFGRLWFWKKRVLA